MSYTVLYRKFRPKSFYDVIGQEHITKTLMNQYKNNRISHAYLFCGTRGTGKTSTAKIFAKLLNCENPTNLSPCNECNSCMAFNENRSVDIFEIDAASNNGVDDIRNIKEEVRYAPTNCKYKIYIIDEVHMLSIGAFNALLKTLEEPPEYVIFILATTDPQKLPITVLSRCQRFDFKPISPAIIAETLKEYVISEKNINIDDDALKYIATLSDGAMRDALILLEQCSSFYFGEHITKERVISVLGSVDDFIFFEMTNYLIDRNILACVEFINKIIFDGVDISQFVSGIIEHFRNILLAGIAQNNFNFEKYNELKLQYEKATSDYFIRLINIFSKLQNDIKYTHNPKIALETTIFKICHFTTEDDIFDIKEKIRFLENKLEKGEFTLNNVVENNLPTTNLNNNEVAKPKRKLIVSEDFKKIISNWQKDIIKIKDNFIKGFLQQATPANLEDDKLYIIYNNVEMLKKKEQEITQELSEIYNMEINLEIVTQEEFNRKKEIVLNSEPKVEQKTSVADQFEMEAKEMLPEHIISN